MAVEASSPSSSEIVTLNVGGQRFDTTRHTLLSINDTFFSVLLSGRLPSSKDQTGALFIDRDPALFAIILNYLRTNQLFAVTEANVEALKHEAQFYGINPLVRQLELYSSLVESPTCSGDILFQSLLKVNKPSESVDLGPVKQIVSFDNGLVVVYNHCVNCYRLSDNYGWQCVFESGFIENEIVSVDFHFEFSMDLRFMLAICEKEIRLLSTRRLPYQLENNGGGGGGNNQPFNNNSVLYRSRHSNTTKTYQCEEIGRFHLNNYPIDSMFFIGTQLVALSKEKGRVGIWNSSRRWLVQDLKPNKTSVITAYDKAESDYLFLCSNQGTIFLIDMQKFPLRLKDGDLLINEFYKDPEGEEICAISCFLCASQRTDYFPISEKSIEIAYGTKNGTVRILVHHPETVGQGPQLFQTIKVHMAAIRTITLNSDYLITMCERLHVRTWALARFRGLISTQPGTTSHASFQVHSFHSCNSRMSPAKSAAAALHSPTSSGEHIPASAMSSLSSGLSSMAISSETLSSSTAFIAPELGPGPFGNQREGEKQVLVEVAGAGPPTRLNILYAANGQKICSLRSVDGSPVSAVSIMYQHDARYRQFIITGHRNGFVQIWDLSTAMDLQPKDAAIMAERSIDRGHLLRHIFQ